jgi:hypothetical protein
MPLLPMGLIATLVVTNVLILRRLRAVETRLSDLAQ